MQLVVPDLYRVAVRLPRSKSLPEPVELSDVRGKTHRLESETKIGIGTLRSVSKLVFRSLGIVDRSCRSACMNQSINQLFEKTLGGDLLNDGRIDPTAFKKLLGAIPLTKATKIGGMPLPKIVSPFQTTISDYLSVRSAIRSAGDKTLKRQFAKAVKDDPNAMIGWYGTTAKAKNLGAGVSTENTGSTAMMTGFWMRRIADDSADDIEATLKKLSAMGAQ